MMFLQALRKHGKRVRVEGDTALRKDPVDVRLLLWARFASRCLELNLKADSFDRYAVTLGGTRPCVIALSGLSEAHEPIAGTRRAGVLASQRKPMHECVLDTLRDYVSFCHVLLLMRGM
jgi:hypothetical protein